MMKSMVKKEPAGRRVFEQQPKKRNKDGAVMSRDLAGVPPPDPLPSTPNPQTSTLPLLSRRELAAQLKVSLRTVDRLVSSGQVPVLRLRGRPRFFLPDVLARLRSLCYLKN